MIGNGIMIKEILLNLRIIFKNIFKNINEIFFRLHQLPMDILKQNVLQLECFDHIVTISELI